MNNGNTTPSETSLDIAIRTNLKITQLLLEFLLKKGADLYDILDKAVKRMRGGICISLREICIHLCI